MSTRYVPKQLYFCLYLAVLCVVNLCGQARHYHFKQWPAFDVAG